MLKYKAKQADLQYSELPNPIEVDNAKKKKK